MDGSASDGGERKRAGLHAESEQAGHFRTSAPAKLIRASSGLGLRAPPSRTPIVQAPARPITPGPGPVKAPGSRAAAGRRAAMRSTLDAGGRPVRCAARARGGTPLTAQPRPTPIGNQLRNGAGPATTWHPSSGLSADICWRRVHKTGAQSQALSRWRSVRSPTSWWASRAPVDQISPPPDAVRTVAARAYPSLKRPTRRAFMD